MLTCLQEAAQASRDVIVLLLDEMGYFRWPDATPNWAEEAPARAPEAVRAGPTIGSSASSAPGVRRLGRWTIWTTSWWDAGKSSPSTSD